jgi:hypothetical protein
VVRVRLDKKATSISLLVALGVRSDGQKVLLAIKNMGGESEAAWRTLLDDLVARGLTTPELVIVDGGSGLDKALAALWPETPVQRCTVYKHRNLLAHAADRLHEEVSADYDDMIYAATAREAEEVFLIDGVQYADHGALDDLVLQRRDRHRPSTPVRFGYVDPPARRRPVPSAVNARMQARKTAVEVRHVFLPCHSVDPGSGVLRCRAERLLQSLDGEVMQEGGELLLLVAPCSVRYALQRLRRVGPALCQERALLDRIPLGPRPWLHRLRPGSLQFVRERYANYRNEIRRRDEDSARSQLFGRRGDGCTAFKLRGPAIPRPKRGSSPLTQAGESEPGFDQTPSRAKHTRPRG